MKELEDLICYIFKLYENINNLWENKSYPNSFNMKKITVNKVYYNREYLLKILVYREFLISNKVDKYIKNLSENIEARIKTKNSIYYKLEIYTKTHENGNIPLNKCLNDIFGIRIIINDKVTEEDIINLIKNKYPKLKCINSNKLDYKAIHVYFGKGNNKLYEWELQIWLNKDKDNNYKSHGVYKQDYIKWENERSE